MSEDVGQEQFMQAARNFLQTELIAELEALHEVLQCEQDRVTVLLRIRDLRKQR